MLETSALAFAEEDAGPVGLTWQPPDGVRTDGWVGLTGDGRAGYAVIPDATRGTETTIVGAKRPGPRPKGSPSIWIHAGIARVQP